jgi:hypothetical protein
MVSLGSRSLGRSPIRKQVPCGKQTLRLELDQFQPQELTVSLRRGYIVDVSIQLERPRATLSVVSSPGGAQVSVNGDPVGTTPLVTKLPAFVTSSVTLRKPGHDDVIRRVRPTSSTVRVAATLRPSSRPSGGSPRP